MFFWIQLLVTIPPSVSIYCYACGCDAYSSFLPTVQVCTGKCKGIGWKCLQKYNSKSMEGEDNVQRINCPRGFCHSLANKNDDGTKSYITKNCYNKEEDPLTYWRGLPAETNATTRKINNCYSLKMFRVDTEECLCNLNYCNSSNSKTQKVRLFICTFHSLHLKFPKPSG